MDTAMFEYYFFIAYHLFEVRIDYNLRKYVYYDKYKDEHSTFF